MKMEGVSFELPNSWVTVKLGDFVENEKGKKPKNESKVETASHSIPYVDIQAFEENVIRTWTDGSGCRLCYETDFLMVWDGSRSGLVGKGMNGALGSTLVRIYFPSMVNDYAFYFLQSKYQQINTRAKGVGIPHVDPALLWNYDFPIAPLNEQYRIVAKIEELFSELDKGIENLKTARAQLKVYRQALLKHAFEGKLTAQWRAENQDKLETADDLQKRIQQERVKRYQQQLAAWEAADKQGSKPKAPKPLPPFTAEELAEFPELPQGWGWVRLGDILSVSSGSGLTSSQMNGGSFPVYGGNGISGFHNEYLFENETLILGRVGAKCGVVHITRPKSWITDNALIVDFLIHSLDLRYMKLRLEYLDLNKHSVSTAQPVISGSKIYPLFIGLPCLQEQIEIANQIESRLSEVDQLELTINTSLQQAEALRQSILKKAFSGLLVPQDPHDEPASALLARIKAERVKIGDNAAKPRRAKKVSA